MNPIDKPDTMVVPWQELIQAAIAARKLAYAPYSRFHVGAAVLGSDRLIHRGANIENASYSLTLCAERVAMANALMAGCQTLLALAVASKGGVAPCGACRQFLAEFSADADVTLIDTENLDSVRTMTLAELLPLQFGRRMLEQRAE